MRNRGKNKDHLVLGIVFLVGFSMFFWEINCIPKKTFIGFLLGMGMGGISSALLALPERTMNRLLKALLLCGPPVGLLYFGGAVVLSYLVAMASTLLFCSAGSE